MSNYPGALSGGFVSHRFVSLKSDQPDPSLINSSNWNQSHIIGSGAIQSGAFGAWAITSGNLASGSVIAGSVSSGAISSGALGASMVNSGNINSGAILLGNTASGAITSGNLAANSVVSGDLASGAVTYGTIASGAVSSGTVGSGSVLWNPNLAGKPFVLVTQSGPSDGGDYGPGTIGTTTVGIQEAINKLSNSGGVVFIGAGTYPLPTASGTEFITIPSNVTLKGAGMDTTILSIPNQQQANAPNAIRNSNLSGGNVGISIEDLTIFGNATAIPHSQVDTGAGILFIGVSNSQIRRVKVKGMAGTTVQASHEVDVGYVYTNSQNPLVSYDVIITECVLLSNGFGGFTGGNVSNLVFGWNYVSATDTPVSLGGGKSATYNNQVVHNRFDETGNNGEITFGSIAVNSPVITVNAQNANAYNILVAYNQIRTTATPGMMAENHGSSGLNLYADFIGNEVWTPSSGGAFVFQIDPNCTGKVRFLNNRGYNTAGCQLIAPCQASHNYFENGTQCLLLSTGITFDYNELNHMNSTLTNGAISIGVDLASTVYTVGSLRIRGNRLYDDYATPINKGGIVLYGGATNNGGNIVAENSLENLSVPASTITGFGKTDFVKTNRGYNPVGIISQAIASGIIGVGGVSGTTPASGMTYVVAPTDLLVSSVSGGTVSITVTDSGGTAIVSGQSTLAGFFLPIGSRITWGTFTSAPTVTVFGN